MGISGHILGDRKLRQLNRESGMDFDRAYRYHGPYYARRINADGRCEHFVVNEVTWEAVPYLAEFHWTSCPKVTTPAE